MKGWIVIGFLCCWTLNVSPVLALGGSDYVGRMDWSQMNYPEKEAYVSGFMKATRVASQQEGFLGLGLPVSDVIQHSDQPIDVDRTDWNQMTDPVKVAHTIGLKDAERGVRLKEGLGWVGVSVSEVVQALNSYYADSRRRGLPVPLALVFLHGQVAGVDSRRAQELTK